MKKIITWGGKITKIQDNADKATNDVIVKCNCSEYYIDITDVTFLQKSGQMLCEDCGTDIELVPEKERPYSFPYIKTSDKKDLQLDHSYINNEQKNKHWSDLSGGIEEYEDVHNTKFNGNNGVVDIT